MREDDGCRWLPLPRKHGGTLAGRLVPPVETRKVTGIPGLAESWLAQIPVWTDFLSHGAQVVPKIDNRRTTPEPVAVIVRTDLIARSGPAADDASSSARELYQ